MGGNALNCETKRLTALEYFALSGEVFDLLYGFGLNAFPIVAYENKETFGDLDIIVSKKDSPILVPNDISTLFKSKDSYINSNVWSFEYKDFQVDLILTPPSDVNIGLFYFSYNDFGNLLGRIFHKFGLKFGHDGLFYIIRDGDYHFKEVLLSKDPRTILSFLGLSFSRYTEGFSNLEDIFKFVSSSPYFNPDIYLLDNLNHQSRTRDRKRTTYNAFLKWCADQHNLTHFEFPPKDQSLKQACEFFPFLGIELINAQREIERKRLVKQKFNGEIIGKRTGLSGRNLGEFMVFFKNSYDSKEIFEEGILSTPEPVIKDLIDFHFQRYQLKKRNE